MYNSTQNINEKLTESERPSNNKVLSSKQQASELQKKKTAPSFSSLNDNQSPCADGMDKTKNIKHSIYRPYPKHANFKQCMFQRLEEATAAGDKQQEEFYKMAISWEN